MAWFIDDFDQTRIYVTDAVRQWYIPKFRIHMTIDGDFVNLYWNDREQGAGGSQRLLKFNYNDVVDSYSGYVDNPSSAADLKLQIDAMIVSGWTSIGGGDILMNKGDLITHNGVSDVIHPAGPDRSLLGYDSTSSDGLANYTPASVLANANGVVGPASAVDNNIPLFDGVTGKLLKDSGKAFSTDGTLAGNSDTLIPTQKAVKTYVDANAGAVSDGDKGDITVSSSGSVWTVDNDVVTFAKMQNVNTDVLLGRDTAASGDPEEITPEANTLGFSGAGVLKVLKETFHICAIMSWNPVDGSLVFFNGTGNVVNTGIATLKNIIPPACTIIGVDMTWHTTSGVAGSNEAIPLNLRKNDTTDTLIASITDTNIIKRFTNLALNIAMNGTTDFYCFKIQCPTWATNPGAVGFQGTVYYKLT